MANEAIPAQNIHLILANAQLPFGGAVEVGNKAWNLMRMAAAGLPVPPAFVFPTHWARTIGQGDNTGLADALVAGIGCLETAAGLRFGSSRCPLVVSVRSGAAISMPGMLETVLDVGLNADTVDGMIRLTGNPRLAWDSYRRLIQGFARVARSLPTEPFDRLVNEALSEAGVSVERELDHRSLRRLAQGMLEQYHALTGGPFPEDPHDQLIQAATAVFLSWNAPKAATYRRLSGIGDTPATAVTVQTMVFGNAGGGSGAGVGFTRNPGTGEPELYIDFQFNAQGEDVVAGRQVLTDRERLRTRLPAIWQQLGQVAHILETEFGDAQDFEFTVQDGKLYLLQTRDAKRTPWAAVRIAVDLVEAGISKPKDALERLRGLDLAAVSRTRFSSERPGAIANATVASVGVASGAIALDAAAVERRARAGEQVVLVRAETTTDDIAGMAQACGILTGSGGRTSHAAVVARQLGKVCLVGCTELTIDLQRRLCRIGERTFPEGDFISLDGNDGGIYAGRLAVLDERPERELAIIAGWSRAAV